MSNLVNIQASIEQLGRQIFELVDRDSRAQNLFAKKDFYGRLMEWSMRDPLFKTQMFRFVDVLPTLRSADEVIKHLSEYLNDTNTPVSTFLQGALRNPTAAPGQFPNLLLGFALAEATGLFGLVIALILLFVF